MKKKVLSLVGLFLIGAITVFAQSKTEKFKVYGACGMCENRIEKAAKSVDGVTAADWDQKTNMLELTYDESKTNSDKVHLAVAKVGHDTDKQKAKDEVYNNLHSCCKYERPKVESESKKPQEK
jgi:periplasmic mercuric ion binding protein